MDSNLNSVVSVTILSLAVATWLSAERNAAFLTSFNTTLVYMKLGLYVYSVFGEPCFLVAYILVDILQCFTNYSEIVAGKKNDKDEAQFVWDLVKFTLINVAAILLLWYSDINWFVGYILKLVFFFSVTYEGNVTSLVECLSALYMAVNIDRDDPFLLEKLLFTIPGIRIYLSGISSLKTTTTKEYLYDRDFLLFSKKQEEAPPSKEEEEEGAVVLIFFGLVTVPVERYKQVKAKVNVFLSFLKEEEEKVEPPPSPPASPMNALCTLIAVFKKHNVQGDGSEALKWVRVAGHLMNCYLREVLDVEKDEVKRGFIETYLTKQGLNCKLPLAHVDEKGRIIQEGSLSSIEEEEDESNQEERKEEEASPSSSTTPEENTELDEDSARHIL